MWIIFLLTSNYDTNKYTNSVIIFCLANNNDDVTRNVDGTFVDDFEMFLSSQSSVSTLHSETDNKENILNINFKQL